MFEWEPVAYVATQVQSDRPIGKAEVHRRDHHGLRDGVLREP